MIVRVTCFLFLALFFALVPVTGARGSDRASGWNEAFSNCQAHMAWVIANANPTPANTPTGCVLNKDALWFEMTRASGSNMWCFSFGEPADLGYCGFDGPLPPNCKAGGVQPIWDTIDKWGDGTTCDAGCEVALNVGGPFSGLYATTGRYCPYDRNKNPAPPKPDDPPKPEPPQCNADGSCQVCVGDQCVTFDAPKSNPPPPPSASSSGDPGNHNTDSHTEYNYGGGGGYPPSGSTSGDPAPGGTSGGAPGGDGGGSGPPTSADTKCTTGVCDVGEADGDIGTMYQHSGATISGTFSKYMAEVKGAPVVAAAGSFFGVQAGGSCPSWHIPGNQYWGPAGFDFSFFCSAGMLAIFQLAGYLVLAAGAFCAFRIALY